MRKIHLPVAFFVTSLIFYSIGSAQEKAYSEGYKDAKWGMSKDQVKACFEGMNITEEENSFSFPTRIADENIRAGFGFVDDKLYGVLLTIEIHTTNRNTYLITFDKFHKLLIDKYGKPKRNIRRGSNNRYTKDIDAIARGDGVYLDEWITKESEITLMLSGDNYDLSLIILYQCTKLRKEIDMRKLRKSKDNL